MTLETAPQPSTVAATAEFNKTLVDTKASSLSLRFFENISDKLRLILGRNKREKKRERDQGK